MSTLVEPIGQPTAAPPPPVRRRRRRLTGRTVFSIVTVGLLLYLVLGPLLVLIGSSLQDTPFGIVIRPPIPWSLENYRETFLSARTYDTFATTLLFSAGSLIFAFIVSFTLSMLIERTDLPFGNALFVLVVAPSGIPTVILAISWSLMINPTNGVVNLFVRRVLGLSGDGPFDIYSLPWMIVVQGMAIVPLTFLLITASLRGMSRVLEDAAKASGARTWYTLRTITIPLLKPAIIGALVYQFVTVVSALDIPLLLGKPGGVSVLSTRIYDATHPVTGLPDNGIASAYGVLLLLLALAPLYFYNRIVSRSDAYATVTGKGRAPVELKLGRWKPVAMVFAFGYVLLSFVLPLLILIWVSSQPYLGALDVDSFRRMSFHAYQATFEDPHFRSSLLHTLQLGVASAILAMALSVAVSWIIVRGRSRYRALVDVLAFLPHAFPGVVIGLATLLLYLLFPIGVYGTVWIIVIAMTTQFVGLGTRLTTSGIAQIQERLEEAALTSGAGGFRTFVDIQLPLLKASILNGLLLIFLASIQNLTLPLMLASSDNTVISTLIYNKWFAGNTSGTAALGVVLTCVTLIMTIFLRRSSGART
jgi:iron(III) transport system permease protein